MENSQAAAITGSTAARPGYERWPLIVLLLITAVWLYRTPYSASDLPIPPDSVEYALAPLQLLETGRYEIVVQGRGLPPRYAPWFSVMAILPAYVLLDHEPGNAILPITCFAVAGVGFAWAIGRRIASIPGGILAALALLAVPSYSIWARQVMTDVPCTALMLAGCLLYLRIVSRPGSIWSDFFAGMLVAVAMLFRPLLAAMLLAFAVAILRSRRKLFVRAVALMLPIASAAVATFIYNRATFGSPLRNGYHFWTPVPSDYPALIFSLQYVRSNIHAIAATVLPALFVIAIVAWLLLRRRRDVAVDAAYQPLAQTVTFVLFTTVSILLFHLLYFFPGDRFHLPMMAGTAVIAGSLVALLLGPRWSSTLKLLLPALLLLATVMRIITPEPAPNRRLAAERVRLLTPENAMVISAIDPVYLGWFAAHGSPRQIVPVSRRVEYASKLIAPKKIVNPEPPPLRWSDHRAVGLIRGGAQEAVPFVASEQMDALTADAARGTPLFLEAMFLGPADAEVLARIQQRFALIPRAPGLYEMRLL